MITRILSIALAALLVIPLLLGTSPVDAKKKKKTVTRSFSFSSEIVLPGSGEADPYPAPIRVTSKKLKLKKAKIQDVNVTIHDFSYDVPDDINVLLVAPDGSNAIIMSNVGAANAVSGITLKLDDAAAESLPDAGQLVSGTFKPTNIGGGDIFPAPAPTPSGDSELSVFNGNKPNGEWQLFVYDNAGNGPGEFDGGWSLQIKAKGKVKKKH